MLGAVVLLGLSSRTPILTYHDILPVRDSRSVWFDCTVNEFKAQIQFLKRKGAIFVSSQQVGEAIQANRPLPKKAVCITFADNYAGFYKYAWPIIRKEKIPVTQFVHTGFVGSSIGRAKMSWAQLRELDRSGLVTIASQTVTHPSDLTKLSDTVVLKEFRDSKATLEKQLGHPVIQIAYPNGKFNDRVARLAKGAGYRFGFTEECQPAEHSNNVIIIPRYVHTKLSLAWSNKK